MRRLRTTSANSTDPPAAAPRLARLDGDHVAVRPERVRRAGHRLDGHRAAEAVAVQGVPGENLPPAEGPVGPDFTYAVAVGQPHRGHAGVVAYDVAERGVQ